MTALAEALLAAQRQAIGALSKAYVAGAFEEPEDFCQALSDIGATDRVDQEHLERSLRIIQTYGAPMPAAARADAPPKTVTTAQRARIEKTAKERNYPLPDFDGLTMAQASEVIQTMDDGNYDADRWSIPF